MRSHSRRRVAALAGVQLGDAAFDVLATEWVSRDLERLQLPRTLSQLLPIVKSASAVGLLAGLRWPRLGRLTADLLVVYFVLALGAHVRVRDAAPRYGPAAAMLGWSAAARNSFSDD